MNAETPRQFRHATPDMGIEERRVAEAFNSALLAEIGAGYRTLVERLEQFVDDHSPGAIWRRAYRRSIQPDRAESARRWKARAIGLNPGPLHNAIALSGMAPLQVDDRWQLAVAIPQPHPVGGSWFDIEDVVLIDPADGKSAVIGDAGATHISPPMNWSARLEIFTDAKAWGRAIALERLEWYRLRAERCRKLKAEPTWHGYPAAALLLADPSKVRWSDFTADVLEVPVHLRETIRRSVLAQARLPKIEGRA